MSHANFVVFEVSGMHSPVNSPSWVSAHSGPVLLLARDHLNRFPRAFVKNNAQKRQKKLRQPCIKSRLHQPSVRSIQYVKFVTQSHLVNLHLRLIKTYFFFNLYGPCTVECCIFRTRSHSYSTDLEKLSGLCATELFSKYTKLVMFVLKAYVDNSKNKSAKKVNLHEDRTRDLYNSSLMLYSLS